MLADLSGKWGNILLEDSCQPLQATVEKELPLPAHGGAEMGLQDQDLLAGHILPAPASQDIPVLLTSGLGSSMVGVPSSFGEFSAALGGSQQRWGQQHCPIPQRAGCAQQGDPEPRRQGVGQAQIMETLFLM